MLRDFASVVANLVGMVGLFIVGGTGLYLLFSPPRVVTSGAVGVGPSGEELVAALGCILIFAGLTIRLMLYAVTRLYGEPQSPTQAPVDEPRTKPD